MDLSLRSPVPNLARSTRIVKPIPRRPWPTMWYRTMWPAFVPPSQNISPLPPSSWNSICPKLLGNYSGSENSDKSGFTFYKSRATVAAYPAHGASVSDFHENNSKDATERQSVDVEHLDPKLEPTSSARLFLDITSASNYGHPTNPNVLLDIATCDGPVHFERVSNPNFALTVQHSGSGSGSASGSTDLPCDPDSKSSASRSKIYTCIYCQQSFKSLFCYQKHKKRHINPVSVDLTSSTSAININSENNQDAVGVIGLRKDCKPQTAKYLNVQFFPCKICGCKFPSYYFVHKHIKLCH